MSQRNVCVPKPLVASRFPSVSFAFLPADIVTQTLNFGLPSPLDIQVSGINTDANRELANNILQADRMLRSHRITTA